MARDSFILHTAMLKPIQGLSNEALGRLFRALYAFATEGVEDVAEDIAIPFAYIINQLKMDAAKYEGICEKRRNAARKGGLQKAANATIWQQMQASAAYNDNVNDNDNVNVNDNVCVYDTLNARTREGDTHTQDYLYVIFFRNIKNAEAETARFIAHYAATDWTLQGGAKIAPANRVEKARTWTPQDSEERFPRVFLEAWKSLYNILPAALKLCALSDGTKLSVQGNGATIICARPLADWLVGEGHDASLPMLAPLIKKYNKLNILKY